MSFTPMRFLGIKCQANRHPDVVAYISDSVAVAVESILAGITDRVVLVIVDERSGVARELERYTLEVSIVDNPVWGEEATHTDTERLERTMRDVILKVHGLGAKRVASSDSLSFKILFDVTRQDQSCHSLNQAVAEGRFVVNEQSAETPVECFLWDDGAPEFFHLRFTSMDRRQNQP